MQSIIISSVIVLSPLVLAQFMRANAGAMFLAGCGGIVLLSTLDPVLVTTAGAVFPTEGESIVRILVVVASVVIATILFKNSIQCVSRMLLSNLISLLFGMLLLVQLPALTGLSGLVALVSEVWWQNFELYDSAIVVAGLGLSLVSVLLKEDCRHKSKAKH